MTFIDIFNELLAENFINRKQFAEKSGIPYTTVVGWTSLNRLPDYTALIKIADYFGCSLDYLTGRCGEYTDNGASMLVFPTEYNMLCEFRKLSSDNKSIVTKLIKNLNSAESDGQNV